MRNLIYSTSNGTVNTLAEAKASGNYKEVLQNADMAFCPMSDLRKAMLKEKGVLIPQGEYHRKVLA